MKQAPVQGRCHSCLAMIGKAAQRRLHSSSTFSKPFSLPVSDRHNANRTCLWEGRSSMHAIINHWEAVVNYYQKTMTCSFYSPESIGLKGLPVPGLPYRQVTHLAIKIWWLFNQVWTVFSISDSRNVGRPATGHDHICFNSMIAFIPPLVSKRVWDGLQ